MRRNGVNKEFPVVFSLEKPIAIELDDDEAINEKESDFIPKTTVGSISYMPAIMGMMAASWLIREIVQNK